MNWFYDWENNQAIVSSVSFIEAIGKQDLNCALLWQLRFERSLIVTSREKTDSNSLTWNATCYNKRPYC